MHFHKLTPKAVSYRHFKKFENEKFMVSLNLALNSQNINYTKNPDLLFEICQDDLNYHVPRKGHIRGNNKPFMNKAMSQFIKKIAF